MIRAKPPAFIVTALLLSLACAASTASAASGVATAKTDHEIWVLDQIFYSTPKVPKILTEILKTHSMDALIAVLQRHNIPFERQNRRLDTSLLSPDIYAQISPLPAGEPFIVPNGDASVASVIVGRESTPERGEQN